MKNKKSPWEKRYNLHQYPDCYIPAKPRYDICKNYKKTLTCALCFKQNDFIGYIE
mgnify:CR=1 FL=1